MLEIVASRKLDRKKTLTFTHGLNYQSKLLANEKLPKKKNDQLQ